MLYWEVFSGNFEYSLLAVYTSNVKEKRERTAGYEHIHTFRLTLRGTAIVGWQRTQGWGDLLGNNSHPQLPIFSCFFILVRVCGGRKAKRDFSKFSCMNSHLNWSWQSDRHHCSTLWIDTEHTCILSTDIWWKISHHWFTVSRAIETKRRSSSLNNSLGFLHTLNIITGFIIKLRKKKGDFIMCFEVSLDLALWRQGWGCRKPTVSQQQLASCKAQATKILGQQKFIRDI